MREFSHLEIALGVKLLLRPQRPGEVAFQNGTLMVETGFLNQARIVGNHEVCKQALAIHNAIWSTK